MTDVAGSKQPLRMLHYVNQFFGGLGGEEQASVPPSVHAGTRGPAIGLQESLGQQAAVTATLICGDDYFQAHLQDTREYVQKILKEMDIHCVVAGPAFNAGRYGLACAEVCKAAASLGIPSLTAMFPGNPAVEVFQKDVLILPTLASARDMRDALGRLAVFALRLARKEKLGPAAQEGYLPRGVRRNALADVSGAERAARMLVCKLAGSPFETEVPVGRSENVTPAPALKDLKASRLALVSTGGLVPRGNPDGLKHVNEPRWRRYPIQQEMEMRADAWEPIHGGYDASFARRNPNVVVPLDALRRLEVEGRIGEIYEKYYAVVGVGASVATCEQIGNEIAGDLLEQGVTGVILTST